MGREEKGVPPGRSIKRNGFSRAFLSLLDFPRTAASRSFAASLLPLVLNLLTPNPGCGPVTFRSCVLDLRGDDSTVRALRDENSPNPALGTPNGDGGTRACCEPVIQWPLIGRPGVPGVPGVEGGTGSRWPRPPKGGGVEGRSLFAQLAHQYSTVFRDGRTS